MSTRSHPMITDDLDQALADAPARQPLRLISVLESERERLEAACRATAVPLLDVKRLRDAGISTVTEVLRELARVVGMADAPSGSAVVEALAVHLSEAGSRVVIQRVGDELLVDLLRCLTGVGRMIMELTASQWTTAPRLVLVMTPEQATSQLVSVDESNVLDFCDPAEVLAVGGHRGLPARPRDLVEGAEALLAALPSLTIESLRVVEGWPDLDLATQSALLEETPRRVLRAFVMGPDEPERRERRRLACAVMGVGPKYFQSGGGEGAVGLRHLAMWMVPPAMRSRELIDALFRDKPLWRAALAFGDMTEIDGLLACDELYAEVRDRLLGLVTWLGRVRPLPWYHVRLRQGAIVASLGAEELGRVQLAAALETTYRVRVERAHGLPGAEGVWNAVGESLAAAVGLAGMRSLGGLGMAAPNRVEGVGLVRARGADVERSAGMRRVREAVATLPQDLMAAGRAAGAGLLSKALLGAV